MTIHTDTEVITVGAGLAGLVAAAELAGAWHAHAVVDLNSAKEWAT
jgi:predicted oxidoreductase